MLLVKVSNMAKLQCKVLADQIEAQQKQIDHLRQELVDSSSGQEKVTTNSNYELIHTLI